MWSMKIILSFAVFVLFAGCAASAKNASPSYISKIQYQNYICDQTRRELTGCSLTAQEVAGQQGRGAIEEGWSTGVGMVVFW